jgi:hypothetical protein
MGGSVHVTENENGEYIINSLYAGDIIVLAEMQKSYPEELKQWLGELVEHQKLPFKKTI